MVKLFDFLLFCTGAGVLLAGAIPILVTGIVDGGYIDNNKNSAAEVAILQTWRDWGYSIDRFVSSIIGIVICTYALWRVFAPDQKCDVTNELDRDIADS